MKYLIRSNLVQVEVSVNERYCASLRIYPLNAEGLFQALSFSNWMHDNTETHKKFIINFTQYIDSICADDNIQRNHTATRSTSYPYELMVSLGENLGTLEFPITRIAELGYIEEQFINFDTKYNFGKISALTVLYSIAVALTRKALHLSVTWAPNLV